MCIDNVPRSCPEKGREQYVRIKLRKNTHLSWITRKKLLKLKSDDALANYFLEQAERLEHYNADIRHDGFNQMAGNGSPIAPSVFGSQEQSTNSNVTLPHYV